MKLSNRQALVLTDVLKASLAFVHGLGGYSAETLNRLYNDIVNQQSDQLVELASEPVPREDERE